MDEKVYIIRYGHDVIVHDHLSQRRIVLQEAVDVLRQVEDDDDQDQHRDGEEERPDVFLEDICVYLSHL
jgi:hypothetical protein